MATPTLQRMSSGPNRRQTPVQPASWYTPYKTSAEPAVPSTSAKMSLAKEVPRSPNRHVRERGHGERDPCSASALPALVGAGLALLDVPGRVT